MAEPVPFRVAGSGDAADAPSGAVPINLYGAGGSGGGADSVNGQTGAVVLDAEDVGALPDSYTPPAPTWTSVTGKPATFPPTIGSTATTALAGNTALLAIGTTASTAAAGNHTHTYASITGKPATVAALPATLGTAGQVLAVNAAGTGLEWVDPA